MKLFSFQNAILVAIAFIISAIPLAYGHAGWGAGFNGFTLEAENYDTPLTPDCDPDFDNEHTQVESIVDGAIVVLQPHSGCGILFQSLVYSDDVVFVSGRAFLTGTDATTIAATVSVIVDGVTVATGVFDQEPGEGGWSSITFDPSTRRTVASGSHDTVITYSASPTYANLYLDWVTVMETVLECSDEVDNDGDGWTDYPADPGCTNSADESESPNPQCSDGLDNDGDGESDHPADPGCDSVSDSTERGTIACDDGIDNDGDGLSDYGSDRGCSGPGDTSERGAVFACDNGVDDDGDGFTDYPDDPGCESPFDRIEVDGVLYVCPRLGDFLRMELPEEFQRYAIRPDCLI